MEIKLGVRNKFLVFIIIFMIISLSSNAYPMIISEKGTNHSLNKRLIYQYPESYYLGVDSITFTNTPVRYGEFNKTARYSINWWRFRDGSLYVYNGKIWIYGKKIKGYGEKEMVKILHHELCHIQLYVKEKKPYNDEVYAENCILR